MFAHDAVGMRDVVLEGNQAGLEAVCEGFGGVGTHVIGMKIVGDKRNGDVEKAHEIGGGFREMSERTGVGKVAEMLRKDDLTPPTIVAQDGDGVLEFAAEADAGGRRNA